MGATANAELSRGHKEYDSAVKNLGSPMYIPEISNPVLNSQPVKKKIPPENSTKKPYFPKYEDKISQPFQTEIFLEDLQEKTEKTPRINYIGQISGGYLIYDDGEKIILMDPHAAHERINYE